jgi:hypothetical protein
MRSNKSFIDQDFDFLTINECGRELRVKSRAVRPNHSIVAVQNKMVTAANGNVCFRRKACPILRMQTQPLFGGGVSDENRQSPLFRLKSKKQGSFLLKVPTLEGLIVQRSGDQLVKSIIQYLFPLPRPLGSCSAISSKSSLNTAPRETSPSLKNDSSKSSQLLIVQSLIELG